MKIKLFYFFLLFSIISCQNKSNVNQNVITADIDHFWEAYDKITNTKDTLLQAKYLTDLFLNKGTPGLNAIRQVRDYTPKSYLDAINKHPLFWESIRKNTFKSKNMSVELQKGIDKFRAIYPAMKPASIYFTIGAFRTNGTTKDSLVLIGSELAMADQNTVTSEFPTEIGTQWRKFFDSNPIDKLVLLNVHEYVHTQQKPMVHNLLSQVLYEGIAEFVSVTAMQEPSASPAIEFGKKNKARVAKAFENDMYKPGKRDFWLWSNATNEFGLRDLGYYIGYEIAEHFYKNASGKKAAIKHLVDLDYENETEVEALVDGTHFFSNTLENLYNTFEENRPKVINIKEFKNGDQKVNPNITKITIEFSRSLTPPFKSTGLGELGRDHFPKVDSINFSEDAKSVIYHIKLESNKRYQILLENGYRAETDNPLKPYLIDFKTGT